MSTQDMRAYARPGRFIASPRARRALAQLGIDPAAIRGSGPNGRIVEADVRQASRQTVGAATAPALAPATLAMRRAIAQRTTESFATVPHFYLRAEVDATPLLALRQQLLPEIEAKTGLRLTLTDLLVQAMALALRDCPQAGYIWQNNAPIKLPSVEIGIVVGLDNGLMIPVIRHADQLGLFGIVQRRTELVAAARAGKLSATDTQGGSTSLSNLGPGRVDEFAAIIPPPQSSVLAVGRAAPRPFVVDNQLCVRPTLKLCLSVDHRVMDGEPAAVFLGRIVEFIEQPDSLARPESASSG